MKRGLFLKTSFIMLFICSSLIFTGILFFKNTLEAKVQSVMDNKYLFLYSSPFKDKTYILATDDGEKFHKVSYNINDTPNLIKGQHNELILPAEHISKKYIVKNDYSISEHNQEAPYSFIIDDKDIQIESFNLSYTENLLHVNDRINNKTYQIKLPAYLTNATYDKNNIYVLNYNTTTEKDEIHIISRKTSTVTNSYPISEGATEIIAVNGYLFLSTENYLTKLEISTGKIKQIKYPPNVAFADTLYLGHNNNLYVCFVNYSGSAGLLSLNPNDDSISRIVSLNLEYMRSKFEKDKLYILSQVKGHTEIGAKFAIVSLDNLKVEQIFYLPVETSKAQDFLIMTK
ncbi:MULTISPECIES: hypothetical protein [Brevibacillus]|uniref:hypothetical protein n=1 Tax=Brevibacillus TaxID=55080 RepID=UPI001135FAF3|nr:MULTISPECIES: hypothetical protein [Brevibacillus]MDH6351981.1 hypothetical protein [Brevibacillus sp. 1238]MED2257045.1 hypothetical protein [Brevibacillus parabrevis]TGV31325.1 hypothetical protein EN829_033345 [Mesorhizobium sp. M00.F.Ca.ET.186.01.1.1]WDV95987.1 hypothetical protein PSE45_03260 [Brevibacillus parabrevis]